MPRSPVRVGQLVVTCCALSARAHAGPPYTTDDPDPVPFRHWELYLATQDVIASDGATGTAPHVEVNYGAYPGVQLHVIAPLAYDRTAHGTTSYGVGDVELGIKLRFIDERGWRPMVGSFPLVELPTGSEGLGTGRLHVFLPLWLQASSGSWTTYGGAGYWINPGIGNRDAGFFGWLLQRRWSTLATLGAELYYTTIDHDGGTDELRFNIGLVVDLNDHHHLMWSAGRSIVGDMIVQGSVAYQLTL